MSTRNLQPSGRELVIAAVHKFDEAKKRQEKANRDVAEAEHELEQVILAGSCPEHHSLEHSKPALPKPGEKGYPALDDPGVKIVWRIGFYLWREGKLDYQHVAERIWGSGLDATLGKNRVNAHLTQLKRDEVVETKGSNLYEVNATLLVEKSHIPLPTEVTSVE